MSTVPTTNVDLLSIRNVFAPSKAAPHSMNEFYRGSANVPSTLTAIPASGSISFDNLKGRSTYGLIQSNPGTNAADILAVHGSGNLADGTYYVNCNGTSTATYCLMDAKYNGGGWMMIMKATTSATFEFGSNYWTTSNTLNTTDLTRNNADAKYDVFNHVTVKDVMAIWPAADFGFTGGSLSISDGWVWLVNNWFNSGQRTTALAGFQVARNASPPNPYDFAGFKSGVFSTQVSDQRHVFGGHTHIGNGQWGSARWGFVWNENGPGNFDSNDAWGGIGLSSHSNGSIAGKSAGDTFSCCGTAGYNRTMRAELYGR
jgi:hypothetical protein